MALTMLTNLFNTLGNSPLHDIPPAPDRNSKIDTPHGKLTPSWEGISPRIMNGVLKILVLFVESSKRAGDGFLHGGERLGIEFKP